MNNVLSFSCPHCGHQHEDDMELLDIDVAHDFKCHDCRKPFVLLLKECSACNSESTFVWNAVPTVDEINLLVCTTCKIPFYHDDPD